VTAPPWAIAFAMARMSSADWPAECGVEPPSRRDLQAEGRCCRRRSATPPRPDLVARAIAPDYALGSHTASLGVAHSTRNTLPAEFQHGMFIGQHGSWNRRPRSGYKVISVPFTEGRPRGKPLDVLTGFVSEDGRAWGRPVGVVIDAAGALLVADDVGNVVWRVAGSADRPE
jgi:glucose/arabinose dehydrogenase